MSSTLLTIATLHFIWETRTLQSVACLALSSLVSKSLKFFLVGLIQWMDKPSTPSLGVGRRQNKCGLAHPTQQILLDWSSGLGGISSGPSLFVC